MNFIVRILALAMVFHFCSISSQHAVGQHLGVPDYTKITGYYENVSLPVEEPVVLWKFLSETYVDHDGKKKMVGLGDPVVADGVVYFGDDRGRLFALKCEDGTRIWTIRHESTLTDGERISGTPSVDKDHVYFTSEAGVVAVKRSDGNAVWHLPIQEGAGESTPLPIGDRVYVSAYDGYTYALNRMNGEIIWKHNMVQDAPSDLANPEFAGQRARLGDRPARPRGSASDGKIFVQSIFDQSRVIAVDCATGDRRWSFRAEGWIDYPVIANDRVFVGSQDKYLYCLNRDNGELFWKFEAPTWLASPVAVHEGRVYLPCHRGRMFQLDAMSGELLHKFEPVDEEDRDTMVYSFPVITSDTLYWAFGKGQLYAVDYSNWQLRWKLRPNEPSELFSNPATDGQRIFVTSRQDINDGGECAMLVIGRN
jgi:outer membrane protein assembly factor BamB